MRDQYNVPDCVWIVVTRMMGRCSRSVPDECYRRLIRTLPLRGLNSSVGAVMVDDTHRDVYATTLKDGIQFPISSMPGEQVNHTFAGPMDRETLHFVECVALGRPPLVSPEHARLVMQVYQAADQSAESGRPVDLATEAVPSVR